MAQVMLLERNREMANISSSRYGGGFLGSLYVAFSQKADVEGQDMLFRFT